MKPKAPISFWKATNTAPPRLIGIAARGKQIGAAGRVVRTDRETKQKKAKKEVWDISFVRKKSSREVWLLGYYRVGPREALRRIPRPKDGLIWE